ncbi:MAG TPA: efflux RND transporter periplasmic adaptor subunit [Polyangiaceae bacterium]
MAVALLLLACDRGAGHGHDHDHEDAHAGHAEAEQEGPSLALTRWTERYELFVELPAPMPGKPVAYHAHVTRLSDFGAVGEGTFRVRFSTPTGVAQEAVQVGVKRPGIFAFEGPAPGAGTYGLEMVYEHAAERDVFDCGSVTVANKPVAAELELPGGAITFLKESQWKVPFGTAWAEQRSMARELELAADVEPAGKDQLTVGAPTGGRFFHNPKLALAEGMPIKKGDVLGSIAPTVAGDDYSRLQFAVEEARLASEQTEREIARVEPLVKQGLLPERRLIELRNELETQTARLKSAGGRLGRVDSPGGAGGLAIKSTLDGVISQVVVPNGEPVQAGAPLVRIGGTEQLWVRARFVAKPASMLVDPTPVALRLASGERVSLEARGARFLSALPVVDVASRVATWIVDVPAAAVRAKGLTGNDLRPGASVVLSVRIGKPEPALAVPRSAVVEINTRPYVFVQADGEHFEKRSVAVGHADGEFVRIESGVKRGERVVTRGGFDIHLASLMGSVESHRH